MYIAIINLFIVNLVNTIETFEIQKTSILKKMFKRLLNHNIIKFHNLIKF